MAFQCTKSVKLITFNFKFLSTNNFLKKIGLVDSEKCTFCERETEKLVHGYCADTALGLRPDSSKNELQINFCCLKAKCYIWLCRQKKCSPKLKDFLLYFKHIYEMEKNTTTIDFKK